MWVGRKSFCMTCVGWMMSDVEAMLKERDRIIGKVRSYAAMEGLGELGTLQAAVRFALASACATVSDSRQAEAPTGDDALLIESYARLAQEIPHSTPKSLEESRYDRSLMSRLADALSGRVSAPTSDERETLHNAIRETVIAWEEYGGNIERMLKARLYGFRPPVVPVPVYEYGVTYTNTKDAKVLICRSLEEAKRWADEFEDKGTLVRRTKDGSWELVPVGLDKPEVVVICGSTRFRDEMTVANRELTLQGYIVLAPGVFGHSGDEMTDEQKESLDELHHRKIDLANRVHVVNPEGYIGESTRREIEYAIAHGKPVTYRHDPPVVWPTTGKENRNEQNDNG